MTARFRRVAVLGLGLIGGSMMHAMRQGGLEVVGYDIDHDDRGRGERVRLPGRAE